MDIMCMGSVLHFPAQFQTSSFPQAPSFWGGSSVGRSVVAADCHLGALLLQGLPVSRPDKCHYVMAGVAKGTDGGCCQQKVSSDPHAAPLGLWEQGHGLRTSPAGEVAAADTEHLLSSSGKMRLTDLLCRPLKVFY